MEGNNNKIDELIEKLVSLNEKQDSLKDEISELAKEIKQLRSQEREKVVPEENMPPVVTPQEEEKQEVNVPLTVPQPKKAVNKPPVELRDISTNSSQGTEGMIGANVLSKVGIAILVLGIGIGVKYAIDKELISPIVRIIFGYLLSGGLYIFASRLKSKLESYSAVLLAGSLSSAYFITYTAYSFFHIFPREVTFGLMVLLTAFAVWEAIRYNLPVIANFGLVGAYAVPFLLSNNSGNLQALFIYMTIINTGILVIALKRYWKSLLYSSFIITWIIFWASLASGYSDEYQVTGLIFGAIFFIQFHTITLAYKLVTKEIVDRDTIGILFANTTVHFLIGYMLLMTKITTEDFAGLFTIIHGVIAGGLAFALNRMEGVDKKLVSFFTGLAITFLTLFIPIQLNGEVIYLLWAAEAVILFYLGRTTKEKGFEVMSYPLILLSSILIISNYIYDVANFTSSDAEGFIPVFNAEFLNVLIGIVAFSLIYFFSRRFKRESISYSGAAILDTYIPALLLALTFFGFWFQLDLIFEVEKMKAGYGSIAIYKSILWKFNYTATYLSLLVLVNKGIFKSSALVSLISYATIIVTVVFITMIMIRLGILSDTYGKGKIEEYGFFWGNIFRYIVMGFFAMLLYFFYSIREEEGFPRDFKKHFVVGLYILGAIVLSYEFIHWQRVLHLTNKFRLGLTILWGLYATIMVVKGIQQKRKPVRITAMFILGVAVLKLFFYDIASFSTVAKTIVFITFGVLLLIVSYLYNKFKDVLEEDE